VVVPSAGLPGGAGSELCGFRFWASMDTLKERMALEEMHRSGGLCGEERHEPWRTTPRRQAA
jgi:hypothetical protein